MLSTRNSSSLISVVEQLFEYKLGIRMAILSVIKVRGLLPKDDEFNCIPVPFCLSSSWVSDRQYLIAVEDTSRGDEGGEGSRSQCYSRKMGFLVSGC